MQTGQRTTGQRRIRAGTVCLLVCCLACFLATPCSAENQANAATVQVSQETSQVARQIVTSIEHGQWETAAALLAGRDANSVPVLAPLAHVLDDFQALNAKRNEEQQQLFAERYEGLSETFDRISDGDPNISYENAFRRMVNVWKDASEMQQEQIASTAAYQHLMSHARQTAADCYAAGEWSKAYANGVQWLLIFEPDDAACRRLDKNLTEVNAILEFLREDACEDKMQRYMPIRRQTVQQVLSLLQTRYVTPLPFDKMAEGMHNRAAILGDVLNAAPADLIFQFDPNDAAQWSASIAALPQVFSADESNRFGRPELENFLDVLLALNQETLNLPEGFMLSIMTDAALAELDPYTMMVWPYAIRNFDKAMTGQFGGIGVHIQKDREGLRILSLIPDTPAMRAGLQADSIIVAVDGESTRTLSVSCAVQKISGPAGTSVILTVRRPGSETDDLVTLVRDTIVVPAVEGSRQADMKNPPHGPLADTEPNHPAVTVHKDADNTTTDDHWDYFLDDQARIGYLRLKQFTEQTAPQVTAALAEMESQDLAGLVLDLRGNSGGLLSAALEIADLFVDDGFLLQSRGRNNALSAWPAAYGPERAYPITILIDGASASASEIVAGIIGLSRHRAILVGQRSYGKGSMQEVVDLGDGKGKLKYTSAYYYLPNGAPVPNRESVQAAGREDWGIAPDVNVPLYDFERLRIGRVYTKRAKVTNTLGDTQEQSSDSIRREMLSVDHQLAVAVLVLKAQLAIQE